MAFRGMSFEDVLDDLQSRFIINVPEEELSSIERICFQIEQAHWFYEDFIREENPRLPSFSLKNFSARFFKHCPLLIEWSHNHEAAFQTFMEYKVRVPVCGAIILSRDMSKVLLVRGWKSNSGWGFPKGKINKDEMEIECAVREVLEETGYNISGLIRENEYVERTIKEQRIRLYIITGVSETTNFLTQTRKEIGDIKWHSLVNLPGYSREDFQPATADIRTQKFYMVTAFVSSLLNWIKRFSAAKKKGKSRSNAHLTVVSGYKSATDWDSEGESGLSDAHLINKKTPSRAIAGDKHAAISHQAIIASNELKSLIGMRSTGVAVTQPNVPASADSMENSIKALIGINSTSHQAGSTNTSSSAPASVPVQSHQNGLSELFGMMASHTIPSVSQNYTQVDQLQQAGQYPSYSAFSGSSTASVLPYTPINSQSQTFGFPSSDYGAFRPSTMPTSTPAPANPAVGPTPISSVEPSVRTASLLELLATGSSTTATPVNIPAPTSSFMQSLGSVTSSSLLAGLLNLPPPPKPFKSKSEGLSSSSLESLQIRKVSEERDDDDDDENLSQRRPPPPPEPSPGVMTQPLRPYIPPAVSISSPVSASPSSARSHFNDALSSTTVSHSTPLNTSTSSYHDTPSPGSVDAYPRSVTDLPPTVPSSGRTKRQSDTSKLSNIISPTSSSAGRPPSRAESVSSATSSTATRRPSKPLPVPPFSPPHSSHSHQTRFKIVA